jgi:hypothetical protein
MLSILRAATKATARGESHVTITRKINNIADELTNRKSIQVGRSICWHEVNDMDNLKIGNGSAVFPIQLPRPSYACCRSCVMTKAIDRLWPS